MTSRKVLVVAPHPDDETLGCGGTLLRHREEGDEVHWLIVTGVDETHGFTTKRVQSREAEIKACASYFGFSGIHNLRHPTTHLDELPLGQLIGEICDVVKKTGAEVIYLPYPGDVHSDHRIVFDTALPATKWFRYPSVKRVIAYEVLSETEFNISPTLNDFRPNLFVNITGYLDGKLEAMRIFDSELGAPPFPRSDEIIRSLASYRGATAGCDAAEAFMILREIM
jgi:N-acetylglucosamine malate deacetylase 1